MDYVKEILKKVPARTILDVATGIGYMAQKIANYSPLAEKIHAVDLNSKAIDKAIKMNKDDRIRFAIMDAEELKFAGNSMDLVTAQASIHHFKDPVQCVSEMQRVLKPNCALLVNEEIDAYDTPEQKIMQDWHKIGIKIDQQKGLPHYNLFSEEELREFFKKFDFMHLAIERQSNPKIIKDSQLVTAMITALDRYYEQIADLPDKIQISEEIEDVKSRLLKDGFAYPPTLVILGMK